MKKNNEILVLNLVLVFIILVCLFIRLYPQAIKDKLSHAMTNSNSIISMQIPLVSSTNSKNVMVEIHEEDENNDNEVKIEIDGSIVSPIVTKSNAKVLIYHTHITESYQNNVGYQESGTFRTNDNEYNVTKIGKELKKELEAQGLTVVHDTTNFEPPKLGTSYSRSLKMIENKIQQDGEYDIYIDIHRDSFNYSAKEVITADGKELAKVMLVVGTGEGNNGTPILPRPDYKSNYAYAKQITDNINSMQKGLAKDVRVNKSRYNQHISKHAILIEMGYTGHNIDQVINSVPFVAKGISQTIQK